MGFPAQDKLFCDADAGCEFGQVKGFGDVIRGTCCKRTLDIPFLGPGGEHDNGRKRITVHLADLSGQFDAAQAKHVNIQQETIKRRCAILCNSPERLGCVCCCGQFMRSDNRQNLGQKLQNYRVIIDRKNLH